MKTSLWNLIFPRRQIAAGASRIRAIILMLLLVGCNTSAVDLETVTTAELHPGDSAPMPVDDVIIRILGNIEQTNVEEELHFDLESLERLGMSQYSVHDLWLDTEVVYSGVLLADLLEFVTSIENVERVVVVALDGYSAEIPIEVIEKWPIIVATRTDGSVMSIADGGPARIIFPYDQYPDIADARLQSVWNIDLMEVQ